MNTLKQCSLSLITLSLLLSSCAHNSREVAAVSEDCFEIASHFMTPKKELDEGTSPAQILSRALNAIEANESLTKPDADFLLKALNTFTRTNIGGSLSELSDVEFSTLLKKIKTNQPLSNTEKTILKNIDKAEVEKVYTELLKSPKIHPNIRGRTSPRAFSSKLISDSAIEQIFESARWAASGFNEQPWRFIYASKSDIKKYNKLKSMLDPWNQQWAGDAPVIAIAVRKKTFTYNGKPNAFSTHDVGMAQANIGFEAQSLGVSVHPMGGFSPEKIKEEFNLGDDYEAVTMMAMGYRGNVKNLPQDMLAGELTPRTRKPLKDFVFEGTFGNDATFESKIKEWKPETYNQTQIAAEAGSPKVHQVVATRASKRAFSDAPVSREEIGSLFEAARWAPSAFNEQPWRFIFVSKDNPEEYEKFAQVVNGFNAPWATKAHVLILGIAKKDFVKNSKPNAFFQHDLGMAQGNIQLQAEAMGLNARQMGGINPEVAKNVLNMPDGYEAVSVIAVGRKGSVDSLPADYREEEIAVRTRLELKKIIFNGEFNP